MSSPKPFRGHLELVAASYDGRRTTHWSPRRQETMDAEAIPAFPVVAPPGVIERSAYSSIGSPLFYCHWVCPSRLPSHLCDDRGQGQLFTPHAIYPACVGRESRTPAVELGMDHESCFFTTNLDVTSSDGPGRQPCHPAHVRKTPEGTKLSGSPRNAYLTPGTSTSTKGECMWSGGSSGEMGFVRQGTATQGTCADRLSAETDGEKGFRIAPRMVEVQVPFYRRTDTGGCS